MDSIESTVKFSTQDKEKTEVAKILAEVFFALKEKGYEPLDQIVGYLLSGDPTYITSHRNARGLIRKINRDEILEELVSNYLDKLPK